MSNLPGSRLLNYVDQMAFWWPALRMRLFRRCCSALEAKGTILSTAPLKTTDPVNIFLTCLLSWQAIQQAQLWKTHRESKQHHQGCPITATFWSPQQSVSCPGCLLQGRGPAPAPEGLKHWAAFSRDRRHEPGAQVPRGATQSPLAQESPRPYISCTHRGDAHQPCSLWTNSQRADILSWVWTTSPNFEKSSCRCGQGYSGSDHCN